MNTGSDVAGYHSYLPVLGSNVVGWWDDIIQLKYDKTVGKFYKSVNEPDAINMGAIDSPNFGVFSCRISQSGFTAETGYNVLYMLLYGARTDNNHWNVTGVAICDNGNVYRVDSPKISTSVAEGLFLTFAPASYSILASSTVGSTKRFKITVDDSGTLSATEVT